MEAPALLLIDFWRLPSTDVLTKRTDNLSSRTLVNNSDIYEDFQNDSWYLELQAFIFLPSALENHPDMVGVTKAWVQMFGSNLRNGATADLAQTTWTRKFQNQRPTMLKTNDQTQDSREDVPTTQRTKIWQEPEEQFHPAESSRRHRWKIQGDSWDLEPKPATFSCHDLQHSDVWTWRFSMDVCRFLH